MKLLKNNRRGGATLACLATAFLGLGCGREAGPGSARRTQAAAAAAAAPTAEQQAPGASAAPDRAATASSGNAGTDVAAAAELRNDPALEAAVLAPTSAAELRAAIAQSGSKGTLVNVWASWCGPCRREVPMLQALSVNLKPQGVDVVLVSVDELKDRPKALSFLHDNGITLPSYQVSGSIADFKQGMDPRWPGMLPASFLFDRSGELLHFWGGEAFENEIVPVIESFLAGRPVSAETRYGLAPGKIEQ